MGTVPWALTNGLLAVGARGGVALPLALSQRVVLLPSAGVSLIGVVGSGGGLGATGLNAGIAAAFTGTGGTGMRTGVTWHRFRDGPGALWLVEIGIVRGPRRR